MNARTSFADAPQQGLAFLQKQMEHIEPAVYAVKYPEIVYAEMIPVDTSAPEWINTISFYSTDSVGKPKWGAGRANDIPKVDVTREKHEATVEMATIGYDYSLEEINKARLVGINLTADKGIAARRAYEQFVDEVAFIGDASKGFQGLFNYNGVSAAAVPGDGTGDATAWSTKSADLILRDVNALVSGVWSGTLGIEMVDTIVLPLDSYADITVRRIGPDTSMTIMQFIKLNNIYTATTGRPLNITANRRLSTLGSGGTRRMMGYMKSPDVVKMHIPMPIQFLAPQLSGFVYEVPGMFRIGGTEIRRPGAARYADGI